MVKEVQNVELKIDGAEITDSLGRVFKLREPDLLDEFDLRSALGEDAKNDSCSGMGLMLIYISSIDGTAFRPPKSYADIRWGIKHVGREGMTAIGDYIGKVQKTKSREDLVSEVKK